VFPDGHISVTGLSSEHYYAVKQLSVAFQYCELHMQFQHEAIFMTGVADKLPQFS
jgi:hypothetical protein